MNDIIDLKGRVAIVTGAASGIGKATAAVFGGLGAHVIATDINEAAIHEAYTEPARPSPSSPSITHLNATSLARRWRSNK